MTDASASAPQTPTDNASVAEDFIDIFIAPAKVFARRAKASPMTPYLTVCVMMIVLFFASKNVLKPIFDAQMQKGLDAAMKSNPQMTPDVLEKARPMMNATVTIGGVIGVPILLVIIALVTWILGRFIMGGELSFGGALMITSFSWFPRIIGSVLGLVQGLVLDVTKMTSPVQLSFSPARFLDAGSMTDGKLQLIGQLDLFTIWCMALVAIGLMKAAKLDKGKAISVAVILFVVGCIPSLIAIAKGN